MRFDNDGNRFSRARSPGKASRTWKKEQRKAEKNRKKLEKKSRRLAQQGEQTTESSSSGVKPLFSQGPVAKDRAAQASFLGQLINDVFKSNTEVSHKINKLIKCLDDYRGVINYGHLASIAFKVSQFKDLSPRDKDLAKSLFKKFIEPIKTRSSMSVLNGGNASDIARGLKHFKSDEQIYDLIVLLTEKAKLVQMNGRDLAAFSIGLQRQESIPDGTVTMLTQKAESVQMNGLDLAGFSFGLQNLDPMPDATIKMLTKKAKDVDMDCQNIAVFIRGLFRQEIPLELIETLTNKLEKVKPTARSIAVITRSLKNQDDIPDQTLRVIIEKLKPLKANKQDVQDILMGINALPGRKRVIELVDLMAIKIRDLLKTKAIQPSDLKAIISRLENSPSLQGRLRHLVLRSN